METAQKLSPGLKRAVIDLHRYLRDLAEDQEPAKTTRKLPRHTHTRPDQQRILEDPLVPWLKVAMGALVVVAVGAGLVMIQQLSGFHL